MSYYCLCYNVIGNVYFILLQSHIFLLNCDVCCSFPLPEMLGNYILYSETWFPLHSLFNFKIVQLVPFSWIFCMSKQEASNFKSGQGSFMFSGSLICLFSLIFQMLIEIMVGWELYSLLRLVRTCIRCLYSC